MIPLFRRTNVKVEYSELFPKKMMWGNTLCQVLKYIWKLQKLKGLDKGARTDTEIT